MRHTASVRFALHFVLCLVALAVAAPARGEPATWTARWITVPDSSARGYGVYHFRRSFDLPTKPKTFVVHVSGDNRYQLFVNGRSIVRGPARGDLENWRYETVDLAPHLQAGKNVAAAVVWNFAEHAPHAQISRRTAFLLQGDGPHEQKLIDTGGAWKSLPNQGYEVMPFGSSNMKTFYVVGPGDRVRAEKYPWGWQTTAFDDAAWKNAASLSVALTRHGNSADNEWLLVPRSIPLMEETPERLSRVRQATGVTPPKTFPSQPVAWKVPPRIRAELLLDQGHLTTAYPELTVSGGRGSKIRLTYAENLWGKEGGAKGHRDQIEGKTLRGNSDEFLPDGGAQRFFSPLWWRTYRYMRVEIETGDEALIINDLRGLYTGYPFRRRARFMAGSAELDKILEVGWRTARLCAHETYVDCPYYEQLQYTGDTRVQSMVSLYMTGDDRLMRNAIRQFNDSRTVDDLTKSRYPVHTNQYIPTFSLLWIGMLHDHWWYRGDAQLVRDMLPGVRAVLAFFQARQRQDGALGRLPYWNFVDWVPAWPGGTAPGFNLPPHFTKPEPGRPTDKDALGSSSLMDQHLVMALTWAADLERAHGDSSLAQRYTDDAARLRETVRRLYWDPERRLFADTAARKQFSQHANVLAVIADVAPPAEAAGLLQRTMADNSLSQSSIYFRYYLNAALVKAGLGDQYLDQLGTWRKMLAQGLTTWAETEEPSRSECHAWGSSPNIELFRTVLGVDAAAAGWKKVRLTPALGKLVKASGSVPHPAGDIGVAYTVKDGRLEAKVNLPPGVDGELLWRGQKRALPPGRTTVTLPSAP